MCQEGAATWDVTVRAERAATVAAAEAGRGAAIDRELRVQPHQLAAHEHLRTVEASHAGRVRERRRCILRTRGIAGSRESWLGRAELVEQQPAGLGSAGDEGVAANAAALSCQTVLRTSVMIDPLMVCD